MNVEVCGDSNLEPDETFFVTLSGNSANSVLLANTKGTGTITPPTPTLWTEVAGPSCPSGTCLAAVDSVTFVRGPFRVTNPNNFSTDQTTRIILFTSNLGMTDANLASGILSVHINGSAIPPANIEHVGTVAGISGMDASYVIVKLPDGLLTGSNNITVNMGAAASNVAILSIVP